MINQEQKSLYTPELEHDSCGIGLIAQIKNIPSHQIVSNALGMLENMEHRGGRGSEPETGDGAGIMLQIPQLFFENECQKAGFKLPAKGYYGLGVIFFPKDKTKREVIKEKFQQVLDLLNLTMIGSRQVPANSKYAGPTALKYEPHVEHIFLRHKNNEMNGIELERKLYLFKKITNRDLARASQELGEDFYIVSLSTNTMVYKGQLRTDQLRFYYPDLQNPDLVSAFAIVHSRFSTNTFPKWKLAQPFRYLAHNGEINTIRGNVNKMKSKEVMMESPYFSPEEIQNLFPICDPLNSDSANLDEMVELLVLSGRSLPHALMMLVPEAWQDNKQMDENKKAFFKFHASIMEPWDGPAALIFTDGRHVGGTLDRNGLRPCRYVITSDDMLIMASETGAHPVDPAKIIKKGRLQPGKMLIADLQEGVIKFDDEIKNDICNRQPYKDWIKLNRVKLRLIPDPQLEPEEFTNADLIHHQRLHGYTQEDLKLILAPMGKSGYEPLGSMGLDTPLAVLSTLPQHPSYYFKQMFAQVSNPPIDPIRERLVMSLFTRLGSGKNILMESPEHCRQIHITQPVLKQTMLEKIKLLNPVYFRWKKLNASFEIESGLEAGIHKLCQRAEKAVQEGFNVLILSDRKMSDQKVPIPSLLATGAVHHHLVSRKLRSRTSLVVDAGDVFETHQYATLIGYGASCVYPYLAFQTLKNLHDTGQFGDLSYSKVQDNYIEAIGSGLLKIMSKMGISTLQSYQGAQIFEAVGLSKEIVNTCFKGTVSRIGGVGFSHFEKEIILKHKIAHDLRGKKGLDIGGIYQWKRQGEAHLLNPQSIHLLQKAVSLNDFSIFKKYSAVVNEQSNKTISLRNLLEIKEGKSIPLSEVEPIENILKRFATGAMSFGSISHEAHSTLAIAMNRIGGKSNSGEGGEDEIRFEPKANGDWERSAIKQVASGRFGVSSYYLTNAAELQIKIAQGAKPGEGGQLPGHKVDEWIGRVRNSTPGVGLISPPPHHDIYSIEDLAQLIFDLKNANRAARINVKLVSEAGVGTIAAGVAKAYADVILVSGGDGGTGASPLSSLRHAGLPWEMGLAEAQQTLVKNGLRSRVVLQTDGKIMTGRDLAIATLLGAEEWGISTAALIAEGCIMMRKCHLNTCPVGIATQDEKLRELFTGKPEHVINMFMFMAEELREYMAQLGFRTINEMVGQSKMLQSKIVAGNDKVNSLDLSAIIHHEPTRQGDTAYNSTSQQHRLSDVLDLRMIKAAEPALKKGAQVAETFKIINTQRAVGAMLSNEISKIYKGAGLPEGTIKFSFKGSAGQSFGAFTTKGVTLMLEGDANDYFGKGLSGGQLIVFPDVRTKIPPSKNIIIGNVALYGATSGEAFINGMGGERFAVRNSGVNAVVEGIGDHGCEYMTGGHVVVLGAIGRNFAAGMSGGIAYVYDPFKSMEENYNMAMIDLDEMEEDDIRLVKGLITKHLRFTGSTVAEELLTDWSKHAAGFTKVMPKEYKAVLQNKSKKKYKLIA